MNKNIAEDRERRFREEGLNWNELTEEEKEKIVIL